ncbi:MAG: AraC family transcriptional regulator [Pseudomonadota bacterium]
MGSLIDRDPHGRAPGPGRLPHLKFNTASFDDDDRLDALNSFSKGLYHYLPGEEDGAAPRLHLDAWVLHDVAAAAVDYGPTEVVAPDRIDANFEDMVFVRRVTSGRIRIECGEARQEFGPGSVFVMHAGHKITALDDGTSLSMRLPFKGAGYDPLRHGPLVGLRSDAWQVRVLVSAMEALFDSLPQMGTDEAQTVATQMGSLVQASVSSAPIDEESVAALNSARTQAMRRFVLANLAHPELDVARLQAEFNASRATVYRAFDEVGGVARFLREQRLAAIHRHLRTTPPRRGAIRRIAEECGLWDQQSFIRMFRAQYGVRPSDILGSALKGGSYGGRLPRSGQTTSPNLASFWTGRA